MHLYAACLDDLYSLSAQTLDPLLLFEPPLPLVKIHPQVIDDLVPIEAASPVAL
jgi:hypothetical protein